MKDALSVKMVLFSPDKKGTGSHGCRAEGIVFKSLATSTTGSTSWVTHDVGPTIMTPLGPKGSVSVKPKGNVYVGCCVV